MCNSIPGYGKIEKKIIHWEKKKKRRRIKKGNQTLKASIHLMLLRTSLFFEWALDYATARGLLQAERICDSPVLLYVCILKQQNSPLESYGLWGIVLPALGSQS